MTVTLYAKDIMSSKVIAATPDMSCEELQELLFMNKISGVPVVDDRDVLIGVISLTDILKKDIDLFIETTVDENEEVERLMQRKGFHTEWLSDGLVEEYMTRNVKTATPDTPVEELAELMYDYKIHRVIIVKPNEQIPLGVVSTFDLLKVMATHRKPLAKASA